MNITDFDAESFATRTAQVAAAEIYGLLATGEPVPVINWYDAALISNKTDGQVADDVERLGAYVCGGQVDQGERLWRWALEQRMIHVDDRNMANQPFALRMAYGLFVSVCRQTHAAIATVQLDAEQQIKASVPQPGLKREDSIFEEEESLGTLRPESIAAGPLVAAYDQGKREEHEQLRLQRLEETRLQDIENERLAKEAKAKARRQPKPAPISIGEAPASPPVNRGGRGNKKAAPDS